jgi:hypothetical protein
LTLSASNRTLPGLDHLKALSQDGEFITDTRIFDARRKCIFDSFFQKKTSLVFDKPERVPVLILAVPFVPSTLRMLKPNAAHHIEFLSR